MDMSRAGPIRGGAGHKLVAPIGQDLAHMGAVGGAQLQRHHAGRFQPGLAKALGQGQQAQAGPVAVLAQTDLVAV